MLPGGDEVRKIYRVMFSQHDTVETQQFRQRPSLKWAAAGCVRRFAVGDLRDVAKTGVLQMF
jgi:hypothetical protein